MSRHTHDDLLRALGRGELAPVYYLYGTEDVLKEEASCAIVDRALQPHERDFNLDQRGAPGLDPEELHALVNTLPMLASRRCVVIREVEAWRKKAGPREVLLKYLANPSTETVLVLQETAPAEDKQRDWEPDPEVANRSWAVEFRPLEPDRVPRWLAHHAKRLGITFGEGAAEHLAVATGYDLGVLCSELEKLAGLIEEGPISRARIGELVGIRHGETLEDWIEAVLADRTPLALTLSVQVLAQSGLSGVKMTTALGTGLVGLRLARAHYDTGSRGSALERVLLDRLRQVRPFGLGDWKAVAHDWSRWVEAWPGARLASALRATLDADAALKGTRLSDEAGVVTDLVLRLAERRADKRTSGQADGGLGDALPSASTSHS
jgi:DNA polymerase III delta subunit